ncbi:hypothetical protein JW758_04740 [Candidatus Peregrinibacteria bacterium]|nr:hypothetical protein [Candidatus Peregrinibacteria bacterium]
MRTLYLVSSIVIGVLILILASAQFGATCTWYLIGPTTPAFLVIMWAAGLGAAMGGCLIMFWKSPVKSEDDDDVELEDNSDVKDDKTV